MRRLLQVGERVPIKLSLRVLVVRRERGGASGDLGQDPHQGEPSTLDFTRSNGQKQSMTWSTFEALDVLEFLLVACISPEI